MKWHEDTLTPNMASIPIIYGYILNKCRFKSFQMEFLGFVRETAAIRPLSVPSQGHLCMDW